MGRGGGEPWTGLTTPLPVDRSGHSQEANRASGQGRATTPPGDTLDDDEALFERRPGHASVACGRAERVGRPRFVADDLDRTAAAQGARGTLDGGAAGGGAATV